MFSKVKIAAAVSLACLGIASSAALAGGSKVIDGNFVRLDPTTSGVLARCGGLFNAATASLKVKQIGAASHVEVELEGGKPNELYTIWLRLQGNTIPGNVSFGASPLTGLPVTPLAPGSKLGELLEYTPPNAGIAMASNGFTTDAYGNGEFNGEMDFPLVGGAYPFNLAPVGFVFDNLSVINQNGSPPVAIANPGVGVSAANLLRIVSHCTDGLAHGLHPGVPGGPDDGWFDYPL